MSDPAAPELVEDAEAVRARSLAALAGVERIVAVMSGKGGVGKSFVAVHLAATLGRAGHRVGLLDADLHGPSVPELLGLRGRPVAVRTDGTLRPVAGPAGLAVQSMDFFLQGNQALDWEGPDGSGAMFRSALEQSALADLIGRTRWGGLDVLVVDLAPGSDRLPALARWLPPRLRALAVTIPSEVAQLAVERSLRRALEAQIPLLGVVENFASTICEHCGAEASLFQEASSDALAAAHDTRVLARLPFDPAFARARERGESPDFGSRGASPMDRAFHALGEEILRYPGGPETP